MIRLRVMMMMMILLMMALGRYTLGRVLKVLQCSHSGV